MSYAKHWLLTLFDAKEAAQLKVARGLAAFWSWQQEVCPDTGKIHWQAYFGFSAQWKFTRVKEMFPTAHIELARSPPDAWAYCRKLESRLDGGESDCSPAGPPGRGPEPKRKQLELVLDAVKSGVAWAELVDQFPIVYATQGAAMCKLYERFRPKRVAASAPRVCILWGPPGTGKSSTAALMFKDAGIVAFRLTIGKWADGYDYERGLFFDDFSPNLVPRAQLLVLMETGQCRWEVKGATVMMDVDMIIITSNWNPIEWFPVDKEDPEKMHERAAAVMRRARVFECTEEGVIETGGNTIPPVSVEKNQKSLLDLWAPRP